MKNCALALFAAVVASVVGFRVQADDTIVSETNLVLAVMAENLNVTTTIP